MEEVKKKRGRPKKEGSRTVQSHTLYSKDEYELLRETSKVTGKTISDLIRIGSLKYATEEAAKCDKSELDDGEFYDYEDGDDYIFDD